MQLYDTIIEEIKAVQNGWSAERRLKELIHPNNLSWPAANGLNLFLQSETAIELGPPSAESLALSLWTETPGKIVDERMSLVGPDLNEAAGPTMPFGKIVLLEGSGFDENNAYDRYRHLDLVRFDISLKGYMMRAASQYQREWSRISNDAVANGFSFAILGETLIKEFKKVDYIKSVEILFVTSANEDVSQLKPMAERVSRINQAMSKMSEEMSSECSDCDFEDVCDEVSALRMMRKTKEARRRRYAS